MSTPAIIDSDGFAFMEKVWDLHLKSKTPYSIARTLGVKQVDVKFAIEQMQLIVRDDMDARDSAKDFLNDMVVRYQKLMEEAQENLENLQVLNFNEKVSSQINATIKNIADMDKIRVDVLQKAGLYDSNLGDELAEREEREQQILQILRNDLCPACAAVVRDKLTKLTGVVEGEVVAEHVE